MDFIVLINNEKDIILWYIGHDADGLMQYCS